MLQVVQCSGCCGWSCSLSLVPKATDETASWNGLRYLTQNVHVHVHLVVMGSERVLFSHEYVCLCSSLPWTHSDLALIFACVLTDSLSAQRVHTHGRRVRHSSSDSSGSDCSVESDSSSLHSRSPTQSPEVHPDPLLPANAQPACSGNKEVSTLR